MQSKDDQEMEGMELYTEMDLLAVQCETVIVETPNGWLDPEVIWYDAESRNKW